MSLYQLDVAILEFINTTFHNVLLDNTMQLISYFGLMGVGLLIAILFYIFSRKPKHRQVAVELVISLIVVYLVIELVKNIVLRPRPYEVLDTLYVLTSVSDPSFPSGHTATATTISYVFYRNYGRKIVFILPVLAGLSRMYLGVHYPSDVLGGFIIGMIISIICGYLIDRIGIKLKVWI
ncbi:MAG: phosphatase PAP2 family protein [Methanosphaera sp.]|nr:phosphatase PAP2 family protein [Methanosphaera sp.]